jgi:hypothetical protein
MKILVSENFKDSIPNKYIYLDTNVLSGLFNHKDSLEGFFSIMIDSFIILDPYIRLEFLRDIFVSEQISNREEFLNQPIFFPAIDHQQIYNNIVNINSLLLSQVFALHRQKSKFGGKASWSTVDLLLAARVMGYKEKALLLTGDRNDFPACVFETIGVLTLESNKSGLLNNFYLLKYDEDSFNKYKKLL